MNVKCDHIMLNDVVIDRNIDKNHKVINSDINSPSNNSTLFSLYI